MYQLVLLGGMGVGKDYLLKKITERYNISKITTTTTRPIRSGEVNGVDYHFTDKETFERDLKNGKYIEHQVYNTAHGTWFYGTSRKSIMVDNSVIILDKDGFLEYKKHIPHCVSIYISCIDEVERFYKSLKRLNQCSIKDVDEVYRRIKIDEDKFKDIDKIVDFVVPQTYNETTVELIFDLLDRIGFERRVDNGN